MAQLFGARMGAPMGDDASAAAGLARPHERAAGGGQVAGAMGRYLLGQGRKLPPFLQALT